jgi:hypothetical protein
MMLSAFCSLVLAEPNKDFSICITPVSEVHEDEKTQNYELYIGEETILKHVTNDWEIKIPHSNDVRLFQINDNAFVFYVELGYLKLLECNPLGTILFHNTMIQNPIIDQWDIVFHNEFIIVGGISTYEYGGFIEEKQTKILGKQDAFIVSVNLEHEITNKKILGGKENEYFETIVCSEESLFVLGKKDPYSGGDFGNGGQQKNTNFICNLNSDFLLIDYKILDNSEQITSFTFFEEYLYYSNQSFLYKFDQNLNIVLKRMVDEPILFSMISYFQCFIVLEVGRVSIYSIIDFQQLYYQDIEEIKFDSQFLLNQRSLKLKNDEYLFSLEVLDFRDFYLPLRYFDGFSEETNINGLFDVLEVTKKTSDPQFNPLVFGDYEWEYEIQTSDYQKFCFTRVVDVDLEVNVSEGFIYPVGYTLKFTGNATLNGKIIANNYAIAASGVYQLVLQGTNETKEVVNFSVDSEQIVFQENKTRHFHQEVVRGSIFYLDFSFIGNINEVVGVEINGEIIQTFVFDSVNKKIHVRLLAGEVVGSCFYYVKRIIYQLNGNEFSKQVNEVVIINVVGFAPEVSVVEEKDLSFQILVEDGDATARMIKIEAISHVDDQIFYLPLADGKIQWSHLPEHNLYDITISLVYDSGNHKLGDIEIMRTKMQSKAKVDLGEIVILEKANTLKKMSLSFSPGQSTIQEIIVNNHVVYESERINYISSIFIGLLITIASFFVSLFIHRAIKKQKRRYF